MRNKIVAGNWKMNNDSAETEFLLTQLKSFKKPEDVRVMVAPAFTQLSQSTTLLKGEAISVVAQNMSAAVSGAYTGEVSASMLKGVGIHTVILGHSERRSLFHETDALLAEKVKSALDAGMEVIFCFGEELDERRSNTHFEVVERQLKVALFDLPASAWKQIILAYEPVWAIGTGETASPAQAQEMHAYIRSLIAANYDSTIANAVSILYGGSVKPNNAQEIFAGADVDGGLIGGASLKADDFMDIVNAF
ncbi:triose-phosphate isomerase [Flavobacteriaceae bacterium]|jgi:triosephosphate isomerase|nr:triose-phosphate isomerase [Flavobacteriaceae bacterium]MDA8644438.1 triose-phosphate isomerase [Flavobacteriaceae bacterium]MDA8877888.1 triose-phosphate isomerase [Flavobacteriaceae bacterium]MDA9588266.1 triose-phosphate isomerase [Flavobacteriaceae bacterium]